MALYVIQLSDVGEGVAEAELVEWQVSVGDTVTEDQVLGVVMTDKAAVEVPSSVLGKVVKLCADVGDTIAVGSDLIHLDVDGQGRASTASTDSAAADVEPSDAQPLNAQQAGANEKNAVTQDVSTATSKTDSQAGALLDKNSSTPRGNLNESPAAKKGLGKVLAAPSVRQRARELGVDLSAIQGSGPGGRVVHDDLGQFTERRSSNTADRNAANTSVNVVKMVGLRRMIAEKMALAKSRIPHITIVEEIDVQNLEELRAELNNKHADGKGKLTMLPFVIKAIVEAVREQPDMNALFDDEAGELSQYGGVHVGVATQTPNGLMVPVVRHSETNSLWDNAVEVNRLAAACRDGKAAREELSGSTITISSLGPLGALATTPIINHPEVAIVGINKIKLQPHWDGQQFVPRKTMNISCSFDHRVIDGYDAAIFVQKIKSLLEKPAMLFVDA